MSSRLDDELSRLVSAGVLRQYQADSIRDAADAEIDAALADPGRPPAPAAAPEQPAEPVQTKANRPLTASHPNALVEVLGYIGGALLLGAVALLTLANWGEMGRAARISTGTTAAVVLLGAAVVLALLRRREQLSSALASMGCCVAGFATFVAIEGETGRVAGVLVALALAGAGLCWLAGSSLLVATFGILAVGVLVITADVLTPDTGSAANSAGIAGTGFIIVAFVFAMLGMVRDQVTSWSLAGAAMFSSSICWLVQERGEIMALAVGTAGPAALLVAYGRTRRPAYAVVGCAILLVIWPTALYQLTDNLGGVAIGLVVASGVLLVAVLMLSRRRSNA
ncbi:hypothetical protein [Kribbella solani]|uniref:DUF2157 domain-containing protein n=1 Tax=Kribbella solani TaxID=236067 RepID=A0A841DWT9_9ACTN|nr:hypothetical protein [Kribbella solani]MBB5979728.1 hypothetical protein [Kribbella solani]MDX2970188.1 hypothetical protein [Kribbella solani]MDX3004733.1 hypothetical protein [Kribbella solani]